MSLSTPAINCAKLELNIEPSILIPLSNEVKVCLPVFLNSAANIQVISGSFTPANNTQILVNSLNSSNSPNFILFVCDGLANLSCINAVSGNMLTSIPINKVLFTTIAPTIGGSNYITELLLDGTTSQVYPMIQSVAINYTLIIGQANVS